MDFGALPPEVNSGRMYAGPGPGSMLAAAAAWGAVGAELQSTAAAYHEEISGLVGGPWVGPASASMAAAATPYVSWLHTTAAQAQQTAAQAQSAAAAYETAFAMTVPPPVIATNRAQLAALVATNLLGQNTPAIMATEAHYGEMWAQDAAAMYGYAGSSAAASRLTPFTPPAQTTNPAATASQTAAVVQAAGASAGNHAQTTLSQLTSATPAVLQQLATPASATSSASGMVMGDGASAASSVAYSPVSALTSLVGSSGKGAVKTANAGSAAAAGLGTGVASFLGSPVGVAAGVGSGVGADAGGVAADVGGLGMDVFGVGLDFTGAQTLTAGAGELGAVGAAGGLGPLGALGGSLGSGAIGPLGGLSSAGASVSMGQAASLGALSVPQNWVQALPVGTMNPAAAVPAAGGHLGVAPAVSAGGSGIPKMSFASLAGHEATDLVQRIGLRPAMVPRSPMVG